MIGDLNAQATLPPQLLEGLPPELVEKARRACRITRFLFAKKISDDFKAEANSFTFVRRLDSASEVERARELLKARLGVKTDPEYITWIGELRDLVTTMSDEARQQTQRLLVGLLKNAMKVVYEKEIQERAVGLAGDVVPILRDMVRQDLDRLKDAEPDPVSKYLTTLDEIAQALTF